jgi:hypothetical protein
MAQIENFVIDNGTGSAVRADINRALMALATLNSGATAPANPVEGILWLDTSEPAIKIYINDAWVSILQADTITSFPAGTRMIFNQASPPTGWILEESTSHAGAALRVVAGTGGGVGGTSEFLGWLTGHSHSASSQTYTYTSGGSNRSVGYSGGVTANPKYTDVVVGVKA